MYDDIAGVYHLVYEDWNAAIRTQSEALNGIITAALGNDVFSILDVSCGIGTQSLGLAALGHSVKASDLSAGAVARAREEARQRNLDIRFSVADMRDCFEVHGNGHDVVLSGDNSLPHLQTDAEIQTTVQGLHDCLRPGGVVLIGLRDYAAEKERGSPQLLAYGVRVEGGHRYFVFQTRDWLDDRYEVGMYFIREGTSDAPATVISGRSRYYAVPIDRVLSILEAVGFADLRRIDDALYQPVLFGRKATR